MLQAATETKAPAETQAATGADLLLRARDIVADALRAGASDAEVTLREGDEFEAHVRLGELDTLKNSGSRAAGLRVLIEGPAGLQVASTSSSDLSASGIRHLVSGALALARVSTPDPLQGLPAHGSFGSLAGDLQLFHDDLDTLPVADRIDYARRAEAAALAFDPRLTNSTGATFEAGTGHRIFANSRGFAGSFRSSSCGVSVSPIAVGRGGEMQRDYWYASSRSLAGLASPEEVGQEAARRTLRRLDGRKVPTQHVPVVFPPELARSILGHMAEAIHGDSVWRGSSFLAGRLGQSVAAGNITLIDDGTLPGLFGTRPFDGEGLPTRRTVLIEDGVLQSYLLNTYAARKLSLATTASASRGLAGNPGITTHNLYLPAGELTPEQILADIPQGLYVTELLGRGINMVTGDYSRGAAGLWIDHGELTYAVQEITIAGNLKEMFQNITAVANDLDFRSATASPTLRIDGMTIAGA